MSEKYAIVTELGKKGFAKVRERAKNNLSKEEFERLDQIGKDVRKNIRFRESKKVE